MSDPRSLSVETSGPGWPPDLIFAAARMPDHLEVRRISRILANVCRTCGSFVASNCAVTSSRTFVTPPLKARENPSFFDETVAKTQNPKVTANWIKGDLLARLNEAALTIADSPVSSDQLAELITMVDQDTISGKIAKSVLEEVWQNGTDVDEVIETKGLVQIQDESLLEEIANKIVESNPDQVAAYKGGKDKLFGFFVGQVMKETQGKANPKSVNEILKKILN